MSLSTYNTAGFFHLIAMLKMQTFHEKFVCACPNQQSLSKVKAEVAEVAVPLMVARCWHQDDAPSEKVSEKIPNLNSHEIQSTKA